MENNRRGNAKGVASKQACDTIAEPYVGMPIYLDDNFFSLSGKGRQCPLENNEDRMKKINEDRDNEGMPIQCTPDQYMSYREKPTRPIAPAPTPRPIAPAPAPTPAPIAPTMPTCPMPEPCPTCPTCPVQKPCPMPEPCPTCPVQKPCPMPEPCPTCPVQKPCPMPEPCPTCPVQKPCPMPEPCPMPSQGTMPGKCPMPSQGMMPDRCMPDRCKPDKCMPDKCMPDRCMPDWCMPNQGNMLNQYMPNQGMGDMTESEFGFNVNDCAAGCPLAMAYVPWQSWEETYDDEVAFRVGTVFPSLDLPFLGGKRK